MRTWHCYFVGFVLALITFGVACDSAVDSVQGPSDRLPPADREPAAHADTSIWLEYPYIDTSILLGSVVPRELAAHFETTPADIPLTYEVEVDGPAISATLEETTLSMRADDAGSSSVVVRAVGQNGAAATDTFVVHVVSPCPPGAGPGEADFFPLLAGETWSFDYSASDWDLWGPNRVESGALTLTFSDPVCSGGRRTISAQEHRSGTRIWTYLRADGTRRDTVSVDESKTVTFEETAEGVKLPWAVGRAPRYHPVTTGTVNIPVGPYPPRCGPGAAVVTLEQGRFLSFSASCNASSSGNSLKLSRNDGM